MLSINRLAIRQLAVRKGRTLLTGMAIALGVASIFGMLLLGKSNSAAFERMWRAGFGYMDIRVMVDSSADIKKVVKNVSALPGVKGAAAEQEAPSTIDLGGKRVDIFLHGVDFKNVVSSRLYPLSEGRLPASKNEIALPISFARNHGYRIGQTFSLPVGEGGKKFTITGLVRSERPAGEKSLEVYVSPIVLEKYFKDDMLPEVMTISVVLSKGASQKAVASRIKKMSGVSQVRLAEDITNEIRQNEKVTNWFFGMLGAISLVIGMILIYTAFALTAIEREREFGLMKAIGATRCWPRRLMYREALFLGTIFSLFGLLLGFALSFIMIRLSAGGGFTNIVEASDLTIPANAVLISLAAGIGSTVFSAVLPALRVGRIQPLAAFRPQPSYEQKVSKIRWIGLPLMFAGVTLFYRYTIIEQAEDEMFLLVIGGVAAIYLGLAVFMPVIIGPVFNLFERMSVWWFGAAGKLAVRNMGRQSVRSARVATSILIGISLVFLVAIFSASSANSGHKAAKEQLTYDIAISSPEGRPSASITKKILDNVKQVEGIDKITTVRWGSAMVAKADSNTKKAYRMPLGQGLSEVTAIDPYMYPRISKLFYPENENSKHIWNKLNGRYVLANKQWADAMKVKPGDKLQLWNKGKKPIEFTVLTYTDAYVIGAHRGWGNLYMSQGNAERYLNISQDYDAIIKLKSDANKNTAFARIQLLLDGTNYRVETVKGILVRIDQQTKSGGEQGLFYPLFGITIIISLLGVVNTIAMSVLERRRDIGLIKAVGGTRVQIASMIILETIMVTFFGTFLGIGLSTGVAAVFNTSMHLHDIIPSPLTFPVAETIALVAAVTFVALVGSLLPIRMANKIPPVEVLRFD